MSKYQRKLNESLLLYKILFKEKRRLDTETSNEKINYEDFEIYEV